MYGPQVLVGTPRGVQVVNVELAVTPTQISQGLMHRQQLSPNAGMLFLMGASNRWTFRMRQTLIPLDIIFIRGNLTIAEIARDAKPFSETPLQAAEPTSYVLEVNGGWCAAHSVDRNQRVQFVHVPGH